jgi:rsbT co-antagonist protein RsbR
VSNHALPSLALLPDILAQMFTDLPTPIAIWQFDHLDDPESLCFVAANRASTAQLGIDMTASVGQRMVDIFQNQVPLELLRAYAQAVQSGQVLNLGDITFGGPDEAQVVYELQVLPLGSRHVAIIHVDVTERKQVESAARQAKYQQEVIRAQEAALAELSTPLLSVGSGIIVMPLVGSIDSRRAAQVMERMLEGVSATNASTVILDITGIPVVDTQVANALIRSAQAVKLLGAQVILTGIRPEVAQTLIGLGVDLSGIVTRGTLEGGIAQALGNADSPAGRRRALLG